MKKLTPWQRLARIAYNYKVRAHGYDVPEIADTLLRNRDITPADKQRVGEILKEWKKEENNQRDD